MNGVSARRHPRVFNTAFESGMRSLIVLTTCFPKRLNLQKLIVLHHLVVHTEDFGGPPSLHAKEESRAAELLVARGLVESGLNLMGSRGLISRYATVMGFLYEAGEEAGSFIDLLSSDYTVDMQECAGWLVRNVLPLSDEGLSGFLRERTDRWAPEFQLDAGSAV